MKVINERTIEKVLEYIKDFQKKEGRSPSYRQIMRECSLTCLANAQKYVSVLHARGAIAKDDLGKIVIPTNLSKGKTIAAPLVGKVACGVPILAEENIEMTPQLPTSIFGSGETMLLRASGDSMINIGINDGDLLVVKICNTADDGDVVVALLNDSATVKTFQKKKDCIILHPENPKYDDIKVKDVMIQGIVKHVIHSL